MSVLRFLPRFREARAALKQINGRRSWSRDSIESFQLERLNQLWREAISNVSYYQTLKEKHQLPDSFDSLAHYSEQMPLLEKALVRDNRDWFLSSKAADGNWHRTGGSTGVPTSVYWSKQAHLDNLRLRYAWLNRFALDMFDHQAMLWGHAGSFAPGLKGLIARCRQPIEDRLRNRQRFSAYQVGNDDLDGYLDAMCQKQTKWVYGYSSAILLLANRAIETGRQVPSLRLLAMIGEPAMPFYAERVEAAFDAVGRVEYGSVECGNIAHESADEKLEVHEANRFVEAVPRGDGMYDIVVTVLDNPSFPLFRYMIGDTTGEPLLKPEIGFSQLANVQGRNNDFLVSSNGTFVHSNAVKHAMENVPNVARFQAIQQLDGSIRLDVEFASDSAVLDTNHIHRRLYDLMGDIDIEFNQVRKIKGNLAGKHTWVVSRLYEQMVKERLAKQN